MKLNHIAINISRIEDLVSFYENILGFHRVTKFEIDAQRSNQIFKIDKKTEIYIYRKDGLKLELFISDEKLSMAYSHLCLELEDRDQLEAQARSLGYGVKRIRRAERPDLLFINDKSGNSFELKELV